MLIAPTEPRELRELGQVSTRGEDLFGADVFMSVTVAASGETRRQLVGVQRKTVNDFVNSVQSGHLGEQIQRMGGLDVAVLLIEGRVNWSTEGELMLPWGTLSQQAWHGVLWSAQLEGIWIETTSSLRETVERVRWLRDWCRKPRHTSLRQRPPVRDLWGQPGNRRYQAHLLTGFPGLGPAIADRIVDVFGGRAPLGWTCTRDELLAVPGVGSGKVDRWFRALSGDDRTLGGDGRGDGGGADGRGKQGKG